MKINAGSAPAEGRELGEGLHAHGLGGEQLDDGGVAGLDELGGVLGGLAGTPVHLLQDLGELAGNQAQESIRWTPWKEDDNRLESVQMSGALQLL